MNTRQNRKVVAQVCVADPLIGLNWPRVRPFVVLVNKMLMALPSGTEPDLASFYDLELKHSQHSRDEIAFYVGCGRQMPGPILELGCRTGRISLALTRSGRSVWALENSPKLFQRAKAKRKRLAYSYRHHLQLLQNDLASFSFERRFELIILPYRVFNELTDPDLRRRCLENARRHLALEGTLIVDLYNFPASSADWYPQNQLRWEGVDPLSGAHVRKSSTVMHFEGEGQLIIPQHSYKATFPDGRQEQVEHIIPTVCIRPDEMRAALHQAGFSIFMEMGYFDGRPLGKGPELIFVCN